MPSRKYPTKEDAWAAMEKAGKLEYFGVELTKDEQRYYVCNLKLPTGMKYGINIYFDGLVTIREH